MLLPSLTLRSLWRLLLHFFSGTFQFLFSARDLAGRPAEQK
jgi:hypothetical protein